MDPLKSVTMTVGIAYKWNQMDPLGSIHGSIWFNLNTVRVTDPYGHKDPFGSICILSVRVPNYPSTWGPPGTDPTCVLVRSCCCYMLG